MATGFFFDLGNNRDEQVRTIDVEASRSLAADQKLCVTTVGDLLTSDAHGAMGQFWSEGSSGVDDTAEASDWFGVENAPLWRRNAPLDV